MSGAFKATADVSVSVCAGDGSALWAIDSCGSVGTMATSSAGTSVAVSFSVGGESRSGPGVGVVRAVGDALSVGGAAPIIGTRTISSPTSIKVAWASTVNVAAISGV